ncbi:MAG: flagellar biosynthesis protein FlaG [Acidobacteriota bacterium]
MSAESDAVSPLAAPAAAATAAARPAAPASRTGPPGPAETRPEHAAEALFPDRRVLLSIDEATQIVQAHFRDAATGRVISDLPDDQWLRLSAELRAVAATAILDKSV